MVDKGRRYTETEVRQILEHAARAEARSVAPAPASGYTLADIREIARAAGIDPSGVDRAVVGASEPVATTRVAGFPLSFQLDATFTRRMTDAEMFGAASAADRVLGGTSEIREGTDWLEWHNPRRRAFVGLARGSEQTRVRIITDHSRAFALLSGFTFLFTTQMVFALLDGQSLPVAAAGGAGVYGAAYGFIRGYWAWGATRAKKRIQRLLRDIADDVATTPL